MIQYPREGIPSDPCNLKELIYCCSYKVASLEIIRCEIVNKPRKINIVPVKEESIMRYAQGNNNNNKPDQRMKRKRLRLSQSPMRMNEPPT